MWPRLFTLLSLLGAVSCASTDPRDEPTLWDYRLEHGARPDSDLQDALEQIDRELCDELGIEAEQRAFGVVDLGELRRSDPYDRPASGIRYAAIRPDAQFYGASVPKIGILLGYFETFPNSVSELEEETRRELERMIKRSSNDLAAKYSRLVGLERLQEIYQSTSYQLYDRDHGGGIWSGKHYGYDEPRRGDPIEDRSHAVTIRQCLRFYLMLEQGALVSPRAAESMKSIFAAPSLEFHQDNFVLGLRGRDVTMIRKNGLWEDWRLDTARVEAPSADGRGKRVILLAGATHHPRGSDYLAELARRLHDELLPDARPKRDVHQYLCLDDLGSLESESRESKVLYAPHPFNRVLVSWNARTPVDGGVAIDLRVGHSSTGEWSPYLEMGYWGENPPPRSTKEFVGGKVEVDVFASEERYDRLQYRVRANGRVRVKNVAVTASDTTGWPHSIDTQSVTRMVRDFGPKIVKQLDVPFRSQKNEDAELAPRICSPTSVAMVLEYHGVDVPTAKLAHQIFDEDHDIFGNWPRAVQSAYAQGVEGYLRAFSSLRELEPFIQKERPLVISIRAEEGELSGAPYPKTAGHLLVVTGFAANGDVHVNDPAAPDAATGQTVYDRTELEHVWQKAGGVTYVFRGPSTN